MRWLLLTLFTIGTFSLLQAQTPGHLEFSINDTVRIKPDKIIYAVIIQTMPNYEMGMDNPVDDFKMKETEERFIKICNKLNLHPILHDDGAKYQINRSLSYEGKSIGYKLEFKSEAQLEKLHEELKNVENIYAGVLESKVTPEREAAAKQKLLAKLKAKAYAEAQLLAKAFDKTPGAIVSMNFYEGYDSSYSVTPGFKMPDVYYGTGFSEEALFFTVTQSVSFKFELK